MFEKVSRSLKYDSNFFFGPQTFYKHTVYSYMYILEQIYFIKQGLGRALDPHANGASLSKLTE